MQRLSLLLVGLGLSIYAHAQSLNAADRSGTVDSISAQLQRAYIYPEKANEMAEHIQQKLKAGDYDGISDGRLFADALTQDLVGVSEDRHINVRYAPQQIAEMTQASVTPEDEEAYWQRQLEMARLDNFGFRELKMLPGNVGYFKFDGFSGFTEGQQKAMAAMQFLGDASAIIFDLRENGGGSPEMVQVISTYLFNDVEHLNTFYWRPADEYRQFHTLPAVPGNRMPDVPVYVLTSNYTFSAAEEFTYNLKNMERATIVGENTGGGAHPGGTVPVTDKFVMFLPQGRAINPITETNWEGTGIAPHIAVPAPKALEAAHLDALKQLRNQHAEEDSPMAEQLTWVIEEMEAQQNPVAVSADLLAKYAGTYGPRQLTLKEGTLYYARDGRSPRRMIPMAEDTFLIKGVEGFRLRVIRERNKAVALEGIYQDGRTDRNERDGD